MLKLQSRVSPFANRRKRSSGEQSRDDASCESTDATREVGSRPETLAGWPLFKNILQRRCKALALVKKPSHGLHGCVAFEVEWANVRGINYCNELQVGLSPAKLFLIWRKHFLQYYSHFRGFRMYASF